MMIIDSMLVILLISVIFGQVALNFVVAWIGIKWIECITRNPETESKLSLPSLIIVGVIEITNLVFVGAMAKFLYTRF